MNYSDEDKQYPPVPKMEPCPKMDPDIKARWVEALRSGDYQQGTGRLYVGEGFCCLGVLCDIVKEDAGLRWLPRHEVHGETCYGIGYADTTSLLPSEVMRYSSLNQSDPKVEVVPGVLMNLSTLNDEGTHTFSDIADLIEAQL